MSIDQEPDYAPGDLPHTPVEPPPSESPAPSPEPVNDPAPDAGRPQA